MSSEKPIVHVIDDDEAVREVLAFQLGSAGIDVKTYDSAAGFLKIVSTVRAGCIITDVRMPDISGINLLRRLRDLHITVPVIVITAHGDIPLAVEAMRIGAVDFLEKPFADEVLLGSVRSALDRGDRDRKREAERSSIQSRLAGLSNRERDVLDGLRNQRPNHRELPGQPHDEDAGHEPLRSRTHGLDRRDSRSERGCRVRRDDVARPSPAEARRHP